MNRLKRTQFWGKDEFDDSLILQIIRGEKTATACPSHLYYVPDGPCDDGGYETGDVVEVYDLKEKLRCIIEITEVYTTPFNNIPEKLWAGECNKSAEEFRREHRECWKEFEVTEDFEMTINHFKLLKIVNK